jgi:small GTP-binding protein
MKQYQSGNVNFDEDEEERIASDVEKKQRQQSNTTAVSSGTVSPSPENVGRRVKILMLGDSGVGKSSLILRWTLDTFSPSLTSTVGVNFKSKKVVLKGGDVVNVQVWDTAGQEQFHKITTSYYKGAQGIMLVYDVTDQKSLDNVSYWIKKIKSHASDSVQVALIGNKVDLRITDGVIKKDVDTDRGRDIANVFGVPFFETSAKDATNVNNGFTKLVTQIIEGLNPGKGLSSLQPGVSLNVQGITERRSIVEKVDPPSRSNQLFGSLLINKDKRNSNSFAMKSAGSQSTSAGGKLLPSVNSAGSNVNEKEKCNVS